MKGKKKIIKRRKSGKSKLYFTKETGDAITDYCNEKDADKKKEIYEKNILPAFDQLSENLINVYGFKSPYSTNFELKSDCVSFMLETLHKWDPDRGTKAFSYFNVVAKNWFIINTRKHAKTNQRHLSLDNPESFSAHQKKTIEQYQVVDSPETALKLKMMKHEILLLIDDLKIHASNENELKCIQAIETLFVSINDLEFLNKRALLVYVREISGLDKKQLSKSMAAVRKYYRDLTKNKNEYDIF